MKKILLLTALFSSFIGFAQQEVKLDIGDALVFKTIDISYETYLNEQTSFGTSILYSFESKTAKFRYNEKFMLSPYVRHYFTTNQAWNLFAEGFIAVSSGYKEIKIENAPNEYDSYTDGTLGIGIGTKYLASSGLVIDIHAGVGRYLFSANSPIFAPRIGINVGWRL